MFSDFQSKLTGTPNVKYLILSFDAKHDHWRLYAVLKEPRNQNWLDRHFKSFLPVIGIDRPLKKETLDDHYKKGCDYTEVIEEPINEIVNENNNIAVVLDSDSEDELIKKINPKKRKRERTVKEKEIYVVEDETTIIVID